MIARLHLPHQRRGHRGHAGRRGARGFRAFEQRHALLEHGDRGIAEAAVLKTLIFAGEAPRRLFGAVVDETLGEEQSLGGLAEPGAGGAAMDELRARAEGFGVDCGTVVSGHKISLRRANGELGRALLASPAF